MKGFVGACIYLFAAGSLVASLDGVRSTNLDATEGDTTVTGRFVLRNTSAQDIRILNVESSCGCLSAEADRPIVGPSESLEVRGILKIENTIGRLVRVITVNTDDQARPVVSLRINVQVSPAVTITPRFLTWKVGERDARRVSVSLKPGVDAQFVRVQALDSWLETKTLAAEERGTVVLVTPAAFGSARRSKLIIEAIVNSRRRTYEIPVLIE